MTPLRVGLVGAGPHVNDVIAPTLMSTPGLSLVAFGSTDPSARDLADAWGVEGVQAEVAEFLTVGQFDAAVLASNPADHEAALKVAPGLGLPLFVVGPPAFGSAPVRAFDAANGELETRVTSVVDLYLRYAAMTRTAFAHIAAHGRVVHVAMDCHVDQPRSAMWGRDLLDAFLLSSGLHPLGVMAELLGWPAASTLTSGEVTQTRRDDCFVTADFTTRTARGSLRMSNTRNRLDFSTTVTCQDGTSISWTLDELVTYRPGTAEESRLVSNPLSPGGERTGHAAALREFRDACLGKSDSSSTIEQTQVLMAWVEHLRAS
jgi:predicted dehydrogenase